MPVEGQEFTQNESPEINSDQAPAENHSIESQPEGQAPDSEPNPFWGEVEKVVGPNTYKLIQPHLAKADTEARNRISQLNQSFAPWKTLSDQGVTPDHVNQAIGVVRQLNDPDGQVQVYESLRTFLEREGRLPNQGELAQEIENNDEDPEEADPRDQELQALKQQQQQIAEFLANQQLAAQQQQAEAEAESWLSSETERVKNAGGFDDQDMKEIVRIAAFQAQTSGELPESLDAAVAQFSAMRDRIRSTPRPGQLAPRVPSGPGGGTPSAQAVDPGNMSKEQRRELVAQMLQSRRGQ